MLARGAARVHVDGDKRFGLVDDDVAARFQRHRRREHRIELRFDMEALEQRHALVVGLHVLGMARHEHAHEVLGVAVAFLAFDQDFADILVVEIADRALDEIAFLINAGRRVGFQRHFADLVPHAQADIRSRA